MALDHKAPDPTEGGWDLAVKDEPVPVGVYLAFAEDGVEGEEVSGGSHDFLSLRKKIWKPKNAG
jgi:hypothetical protein